MGDRKPTIKIKPLSEFLNTGSENNQKKNDVDYKKKRLERRNAIKKKYGIEYTPQYKPKYPGNISPRIKSLEENDKYKDKKGEINEELLRTLPTEEPLITDQSLTLPNEKYTGTESTGLQMQLETEETLKAPGRTLSKGVSQIGKGKIAPGFLNIINALGHATFSPFAIGDIGMRYGGLKKEAKILMFPFEKISEGVTELTKVGQQINDYADLPKLSPEMTEAFQEFNQILAPLVVLGGVHGIKGEFKPKLPADYLAPTLEGNKPGRLYSPYKSAAPEKNVMNQLYTDITENKTNEVKNLLPEVFEDIPETGGKIPIVKKTPRRVSQRSPEAVEKEQVDISKKPKSPDKPVITIPKFPWEEEAQKKLSKGPVYVEEGKVKTYKAPKEPYIEEQRIPGKKLLPDERKQDISIKKEGSFFSKLKTTIDKKMGSKMDKDQLSSMLYNERVPTDEMKWSGVQKLIDSKKPGERITREEINKTIDENYPQIKHNINVKDAETEATKEYRKKLSNEIEVPERDILIEYDEVEDTSNIFIPKNEHTNKLVKKDPNRFYDAIDYWGLNDRDKFIERPLFRDVDYSSYTEKGGSNYKEHVFTWENSPEGSEYYGGHFGRKNTLYHIRTKDRIVNDKKYLDVEEFQSDMNQEGRSKGYKDDPREILTELPEGYTIDKFEYPKGEMRYQVKDRRGESFPDEISEQKAVEKALSILNEDLRVPKNPLMNNWEDMAVKQMIDYANKNGYDGIRWTSADTQSRRWGKEIGRIKDIEWTWDEKRSDYSLDMQQKILKEKGLDAAMDYDNNNIKIDLKVTDHDGNTRKTQVSLKNLDNWVGVQKAKEINVAISEGETDGNFRGVDIKVGENIYDYIYDKRVPQFVKDYTKITPRKDGKWWTLDLTPELKKKVTKGQPIYGKGIKEQRIHPKNDPERDKINKYNPYDFEEDKYLTKEEKQSIFYFGLQGFEDHFILRKWVNMMSDRISKVKDEFMEKIQDWGDNDELDGGGDYYRGIIREVERKLREEEEKAGIPTAGKITENTSLEEIFSGRNAFTPNDYQNVVQMLYGDELYKVDEKKTDLYMEKYGGNKVFMDIDQRYKPAVDIMYKVNESITKNYDNFYHSLSNNLIDYLPKSQSLRDIFTGGDEIAKINSKFKNASNEARLMILRKSIYDTLGYDPEGYVLDYGKKIKEYLKEAEVTSKFDKGSKDFSRNSEISIKSEEQRIQSHETNLRPAVDYAGEIFEGKVHHEAIDDVWKKHPEADIKDITYGYLDNKGKFVTAKELSNSIGDIIKDKTKNIEIDNFKKSHPEAYKHIKRFESKYDLGKEVTPSELKAICNHGWDEMPMTKKGFEKFAKKLTELEDINEKYSLKYERETKNEIIAELNDALTKEKITENQYHILRIIVEDTKNPNFQFEVLDKQRGDLGGTYSSVQNLIKMDDPSAFPHELGHWGFFNILTKADRLEYLDFLNKNMYDSNGNIKYNEMRQRTAFAPGAIAGKEELSSNALDDFSEFYAEQFSQYVYSRKTDYPMLKSMFQKTIDWAKYLFFKLMKKDLIYPEMEKSFKKIISDEKIDLSKNVPKELTEYRKRMIDIMDRVDIEDSRSRSVNLEPVKKKFETIKNMTDFLKKGLTKVFQATYPVEKKFGKEVPARVLKSIHDPDADMITFDATKSKIFDAAFEDIQKYLSKFSDKDLTNFNLTRGNPVDLDAKKIQLKAFNNLREELKNPDLRSAIKDVSDFIYDYARKNDIDIDYLEDYFYGAYKDPGMVKKFLRFWKTTDRYTKQKEIPTIADAYAYGLELKDINPITNLKREYQAISRRVAFNNLKHELTYEKNPYSILQDNATKSQLRTWKKIEDPVFKDMLFDPDYADLVNNLISTNKVSQNVFLKGIRQLSYLTQQIKFFGSIFHFVNTMKSAVAMENGALFNPSGYKDVIKSFKTMDRNTPEYKDYVSLGGEHKYSLEYQAVTQFTNFLDKLTTGKVLKIPGKVIGNKWIPITPGFIRWMFDEYIPAVKFTKYQKDIVKLSEKYGRPLTNAEKIEKIKQVQNFYGEMNERLFGRSATATSVLRLIFMAPGYGEGNFRAILKTPVDRNYAKFVVNSLFTTAIISTIGTKILTGKWPDLPKDWSERDKIRDLFKIRTGEKDTKGDEIYMDMLTYDKDFWDVFGDIFVGGPGKVAEGFGRRIGGMVSVPFRITSDIATLIKGDMIYDFKGEPVWRKSDTYGEKMGKYLSRLGEVLQPISSSIFQKAYEDDIWKSFAVSYFGLRPTRSEEVRESKANISMLYDLADSRRSKKYELDVLFEKDPETAESRRIKFNEKQLDKLEDILGEDPKKKLKTSELNKFLINELKIREKESDGTQIEDYFKKKSKQKAY